MATRDFEEYSSSGELLAIYLGGLLAENKVPTTGEMSNAIAAAKDSALFNPQTSLPSAVTGRMFYEDANDTFAFYSTSVGLNHVGIDSDRKSTRLTPVTRSSRMQSSA